MPQSWPDLIFSTIYSHYHLYKYNYDKKRQGELENLGITFLRFSDFDVKQNMFSVALTLEQVVLEMSSRTS